MPDETVRLRLKQSACTESVGRLGMLPPKLDDPRARKITTQHGPNHPTLAFQDSTAAWQLGKSNLELKNGGRNSINYEVLKTQTIETTSPFGFRQGTRSIPKENTSAHDEIH